MKHRKFNWYLRIGLLLAALVLTIKRFFDLPDFIYGLLLGTAVVLEIIGVYAINHDIKKLKTAKKELLSPAKSSQNSSLA